MLEPTRPSSPLLPARRPKRPRNGRRRGRRRSPYALARLLGLLVVAGSAVAVLFAAGVFSARSGAGAGTATRPVARLPPALPSETPQDAVGALPKPPPASVVDLTQPALISGLHLKHGAKAGLAFDLADGSVLWRLHATRVRPIASLTKLMTALLATEHFTPTQLVRVARQSDRVGGSRMAGLKPGRRVRADVLMKGLLISSSNNAAVALAIAGAGSERAWVALMNKRAKLLGLACTHYADPDGLDRRNRSCAADVAALAMHAMNEPWIAAIARRRYARVWPGAGRKLTLRTTNHLLRDRYPGAIGLKTGFTNPAGFCLVAIVQRGARQIGVVVLGSKDSFADARRVASEAVRIGVLPAA